VQHPQIYREVLAESLTGQIALSVWSPPGAGAVVVFVPGTGVHPLFYEEFCDELAKAGLAVVGVHLQGHGHSPRMRGVLRWRTVVGNAVDACRWAREGLGLPVVLMGSSQGGLIALLAATQGAPVVGVVAHNVFDPASASAVSVTRFARLAPVQRPVRAVLRGAAAVAPRLPVPIFGPLGYLDPRRVFSQADTRAWFEADPVARRCYPLRFFADMLDADTSALFDGRLRVPVVVLAGRGDPLFALSDLRAVTRRIVAPSVELVVVEADCHLILNEALDRSVPAALAAIEGFLAADPAGTGEAPGDQAAVRSQAGA
jgi:alpha-beta hydrolase superfamily lysophospholipase